MSLILNNTYLSLLLPTFSKYNLKSIYILNYYFIIYYFRCAALSSEHFITLRAY